MNGDTIYHLHFKSGADLYFGSIAAIYDLFDAKTIGARAQRLYEVVDIDHPYENKICIIRKDIIRRKKGKRGQSNNM